MTTILAGVLLVAGFFFLLVGAAGLLRFPDFYSRLHATGKSDTIGLILSLAGLVVYEGYTLTSLKILAIGLFVMMGNPTATHAISRAAYRSGLKPWTRKGCA